MTYKDTTPMKQDNLKQVAPFFFQKRVFVKSKDYKNYICNYF